MIHHKKIVMMLLLVGLIGGVLFVHVRVLEHTIMVTRERQVSYLKEHEKDITERLQKNHPKIQSIQWDWGSIEIKKVQPNAGGIPTGKPYGIVTVKGKFNFIVDSKFEVCFRLEEQNIYPIIESEHLIQDFIVLGNEGWYLYE